MTGTKKPRKTRGYQPVINVLLLSPDQLLEQPPGDRLGGKGAAGMRSGPLTDGFEFIVGARHRPAQCGGRIRRVVDDHAGVSGGDDLFHVTGHAGKQDGQAGGRRLDRRQRIRIFLGVQDEDIGGQQHLPDAFGVLLSEQLDAALRLFGQHLELGLQRPSADEDEPGLGPLRTRQIQESLREFERPLAGAECADLDQQPEVFRQTQFPPGLAPVRDIVPGIEINVDRIGQDDDGLGRATLGERPIRAQLVGDGERLVFRVTAAAKPGDESGAVRDRLGVAFAPE